MVSQNGVKLIRHLAEVKGSKNDQLWKQKRFSIYVVFHCLTCMFCII